MVKWRRKEKNYRTKDVRSYRRKIRQYLQPVEPGKIERVYRRIAKFTEKVHGKGIWTRKIEEKCLETDEFLEDSRSSRKTRRKMYCLVLKIEDGVRYSKKREDSRNSRMK